MSIKYMADAVPHKKRGRPPGPPKPPKAWKPARSRLTIRLRDDFLPSLDELVMKGLHGDSREEVIENWIRDALRVLVDSGKLTRLPGTNFHEPQVVPLMGNNAPNNADKSAQLIHP